MGSLPKPRGKLDSLEVSAESLLDELAAKSADGARLERELAIARAQLASRSRPASDPPMKADRELGHAVRVLLGHIVKLLVSAILGGGAVILARPGAAPERVDSQGVRLDTVEKQAAGNRDAALAESRYRQLQAVALDCRLRHIRAALEREGAILDSLPAGAVDWRSRYLPSGRAARTTPEWQISDDCPPLPGPPMLPPP